MEKDNPTEKLDTNTALPNFVELAKNTELNPQNSINIALKGAPGSGKTSTYFRYDMNAFYPNGDYPTIEDRRMKMLDVHEQRYFVELLDATEAMRELPHYQALTHAWYCVFDVTDQQSFLDLQDYLATHYSKQPQGFPVLIVGTKTDLPNRAVSPAQGQQLAQQCHAQYFETSAKDNVNVDEAVRALATRALERELTRIYSEHGTKQKSNKRRCIVS
jgi:small GTP-binding protein